MATVWLHKGDCESGTLPKICLRCGRPTERIVVKDFSGKLRLLAPEMEIAGGNEEKAHMRVPICERHAEFWEHRYLILVGVGLLLMIVPLVLLIWEGNTSRVISAVLLGIGFVSACVGALGYLFLGPMVLEVVDSYEQGVVVTGVSDQFARAYHPDYHLGEDEW